MHSDASKETIDPKLLLNKTSSCWEVIDWSVLFEISLGGEKLSPLPLPSYLSWYFLSGTESTPQVPNGFSFRNGSIEAQSVLSCGQLFHPCIREYLLILFELALFEFSSFLMVLHRLFFILAS